MNRMLNEVKEIKRKPNIVTALILSFAFIMVGVPSTLLSLSLPVADYIVKGVFQLAGGFALTALACIIYVKYFEKRDLMSLGLFKEKKWKNYFIGLALGLIMMTSIVLVCVALEIFDLNLSFQFDYLLGILIILGGYLIQGFVEELIFRGWMLPRLSSRYNVKVGIIASSIIFAIVHGLNPGMTLVSVLNLVLISIFFSLLVLRTDQVWMAAGFHSIWNWLQGSVFGIKVSGGELVGGSVFSTTGLKSDLLTGGAFGLEGSIVTSLVILLAIIIIGRKVDINV